MYTNKRFLSMGRALLSLGLLLALTGILSPQVGTHASGVMFAAPSALGSGDCSTWLNACTLQTALATATSGDEIWVKVGVHLPGTNRTDTFTLKSGVALYGGFAGTETARSQRDLAGNVTILSGDIDADDTNTDGNFIAEMPADIQGDNAYHVLNGGGTNNTAVLDGFVVTAGQANGSSSPNNEGGGMHNYTSSPVLRNVTFSGSTAEFGGGMYNMASSPVLTNVTFSGNTASKGGGMINWNSSPTLTGVAFSGNTANSYGGGMYNWSSSPTLTNVIFSGNTTTWGGGMYSTFSSNPKLTNVTFSGNIATSGGGMGNHNSSPVLRNVTFSGNTANSYGGGMYNYTSSPVLANVILWGDNAPTDPEIHNDPNGTPSISYSDIQGCGGSGSWVPACGTDGGGNIDSDPSFVNQSGGNLRLLLTSPAIDAGDNSAVPAGVTTDLDGNPRFVDISTVPDTGLGTPPIVDMGAYEVSGVLFAAPSALGSGNCINWSNACTLQTALATAISGEEIWVKAGVHLPGTNRTDTFTLENGVALYGGFAGTETARSQSDPAANLTILSGDIDANDTNTDGNFIAETPSDIQGDNAYHVLNGGGTNNTAVLDGFVVTAGQANGSPWPNNAGGGIYNNNSSPTLTNVTFSGNTVTYGGGMYNYNNSNPTLTNVTFSGNTAYRGGGMYNELSSPVLRNVTFSGNTASDKGGGMYNYTSSPVLANAILWADNAPAGYEIFNYLSSTPTISYSDIQGCGGSGSWVPACGTNGGGNIDSDPSFVDQSGGNLRLQLTSPVIDAGDNSAVPAGVTTDLDGNLRFVDISTVPDTGFGTPPIVDMGAYEALNSIYLPLILR